MTGVKVYFDEPKNEAQDKQEHMANLQVITRRNGSNKAAKAESSLPRPELAKNALMSGWIGHAG